MQQQTGLVLAVVAALLVKHFLFDFVFQTPFQLRNKHRYGHPGGLLHAALHVAGSVPAVLIARCAPAVAAGVLTAEFLVHYHVDWIKEQALRRTGWSSAGAPYWAVFGADQLVHGLWYLAMAAALIANGSV